MTNVTISETTNTVVVVDENTLVVQTTGLGPQGPGGVLGLYGSFIDTTDQPIAAIDVAQPLLLGTTLENRGITLSNQSRINFSLAGTYKILVSLQITNASNNQAEVDIFFKLNGTSIANSNTRIDLEPRKSVSVVYHDCFTVEVQLTVAAGDYLEVWWLAESLDISIDTIPATAQHPQAPSAIVNVAQVMFTNLGENFIYTQTVPASTWTINHNLGFRPSVEICDSGSQEIEADVSHLSTNTTLILFATPVAGFARLN